MKLSVKLLSALTLIAFVAVAVVGLSHSASAAVDAKVYVTNKASGLTTEPSTAVAGRTSATAVYGTYKSSTTTGTTARDIVLNSDRFIVTIIDADLNTTTMVTSDTVNAVASLNNQGYQVSDAATDVLQIVGTGLNAAGEKVQLTITDEKAFPIIGTSADVGVFIAGTNPSVAVTGVVAVIDFAGDGTNAPLITLTCNFGVCGGTSRLDIRYPTSIANIITASVKSVVDVGGSAVLTLTETGRNTGRFEGEVQVKERTLASGSIPQFIAGTNGNPATIPAIGGPITVTYVDALTSGTATNVSRTASYNIDTTVPSAIISSPTTASETQNRLPTFTGTISDNESGLDVSLFSLNIDDSNDPNNTVTQVITGGSNASLPTVGGKVASIDVSAKKDGIKTMPFAYTETVVLPTGPTNPDNIVDFQVRAADLAGNYGYSDAKATDNNNTTGRAGNQPHTIKIDQIIPQILSSVTGKAWDATLAVPAEKSNVRDSVVVRFDGKIKESSVSASDFQVVFSGAGGTFVPASFIVQGADVYLDLDTTIPSNNKPTVKIQGTVQDLAGNSAIAGSSVSSDGLKPVITVTLSSGTGTGTGTEAADGLTNDKMTITVTSDENLNGPPAIAVTDLMTSNVHVSALGNVTGGGSLLGVSKGGNTWSLVVGKGTNDQGNRAVQVVSQDSNNNTDTQGAATSAGIYTVAYELDSIASAAVSTPANTGTTTQANPFLTSDFAAGGEASTVTITSATLDAVDVTSQVVASASSKTFFFQPTTALSNASHTYIVKSTDAAGNKLTTTTKFTKTDRTDFVVTLFAGWNSLSFPSNPIDTDVNSALSNSGVKQVVAYDATSPSQPWRIASKVGSAAYTSQTTPGLTNVTAGPGYWVETANFEDQKVALEGPTGPGDARPGLTTIATGNGWNLVGVVDQSRSMTQKADFAKQLQRSDNSGGVVNVKSETYFNTVKNGRAYTFDTVTSKFRELVDANPVAIGTGIWVFISPQSNGQLPHIVP